MSLWIAGCRVFDIWTCEFWLGMAAALTSFLSVSVWGMEQRCSYLTLQSRTKCSLEKKLAVICLNDSTPEHRLCRTQLLVCQWMSLIAISIRLKMRADITVDSLELLSWRCQVERSLEYQRTSVLCQPWMALQLAPGGMHLIICHCTMSFCFTCSNKTAILAIKLYIIYIHLYHAQVSQTQKSIQLYRLWQESERKKMLPFHSIFETWQTWERKTVAHLYQSEKPKSPKEQKVFLCLGKKVPLVCLSNFINP